MSWLNWQLSYSPSRDFAMHVPIHVPGDSLTRTYSLIAIGQLGNRGMPDVPLLATRHVSDSLELAPESGAWIQVNE